jgi:hypothetical protein
MKLEKKQEINYQDSEEEEEDVLVIFLKENYTLQDYLNFKETREMLEIRRRQKFNDICVPLLEGFYTNEVDYWTNSLSPIFINETNYVNLGCFIETIYSSIKPEYDLTIFYDDPCLAKNMVETYEERVKEGDDWLRQQRNKDIMKQENIMKKYDWKNKKYK